MIMRQHWLYSNFKKDGADDKIRVDNFRDNNRTVLAAKKCTLRTWW